MTKSDVNSKVKKILLKFNIHELNKNIDSLVFVDLLILIEQEFRIEINPVNMSARDFKNINNLVDFIYCKCCKQ